MIVAGWWTVQSARRRERGAAFRSGDSNGWCFAGGQVNGRSDGRCTSDSRRHDHFGSAEDVSAQGMRAQSGDGRDMWSLFASGSQAVTYVA